jgi:hypothetical protein
MRPVALVVLASVALAWPAAAQVAVPSSSASVPTTLYAHLLDLQDIPMNTQAPGEAYSLDIGAGLATATTSCLPTTPDVDLSQDWHTWYAYDSPALVDYSGAVGGHPRTHPERGMVADVHLDPATPMVLHWYWSGWTPQTDGGQAVVPNVVVEATLRTGDQISVNDEGYNQGDVIARGTSVPATLAGPFTQGVDHDEVAGHTVYHFAVPLKLEAAVIPHATGYNLRVDTYLQNPACPGGKGVMPNEVRLHTSAGHRPRLEFGAANVVRLGAIKPQLLNDSLVLDAIVDDAWGSYDLSNVTVVASGPGLPPTPMGAWSPLPSPVHCHCYGQGQYDQAPARRFTLPLAHPQAGAYHFDAVATTLANRTVDLPFDIQLGSVVDAPSLSAPVLSVGLVVLAALAARNRS